VIYSVCVRGSADLFGQSASDGFPQCCATAPRCVVPKAGDSHAVGVRPALIRGRELAWVFAVAERTLLTAARFRGCTGDGRHNEDCP
jgi:hypothetical protein